MRNIRLALQVTIVAFCSMTMVGAYSADLQSPVPALNILYPKQNAAVGKKVNVVLDPMTDWSTIPFFQVVVGNAESPVVDTSSGRHAVQGLALAPGWNSITVRALAKNGGGEKAAEKSSGGNDILKTNYSVLAIRSITVFNREGYFPALPPGIAPQFFHTREHEADCSGCHRLDPEPADYAARKPDDVLCFTCHRNIPSGRYIHGPAAVWNCLACHNPEIYPVKYQFNSKDPWTVVKTTQSVEPAVFTFSDDTLFKARSSILTSDDVPMPKRSRNMDKREYAEARKHREDEIGKRRDKLRETMKAFLDYALQNPTDKVRIEAHLDSGPLAVEKGKKNKKAAAIEKHLKQLTAARARAVAKLLREFGITGKNRILAVGMGSSLPKAPGTTKEGRELNDRVEIVVYPPDVKVVNSQKLPTLADRQRVLIAVSYHKGGGSAHNLKIRERLPKSLKYVKESGSFRGRVKDPMVKGDDLTWKLGDLGADFEERLSYVVRNTSKNGGTISPVVTLLFTQGQREETREFDPEKPHKAGLTVKETCSKCHDDVMSGPVKHGPADAGYCTLCHDPHGSNYPKWTRAEAWKLCTTCHAEKAVQPHVIAGFVLSHNGHPTNKRMDPSRPGKHLSCVSCHSPHSAEISGLLAFNVRTTRELCIMCHGKKW